MYFLALSQSSPVFAAELVNWAPLTIAPGKNPANIFGPIIKPIPNGDKMADTL